MTEVLRVVEAELTYPRAQKPALAAVSLDLGKGQTLGIVGESGSGKTTLGRLLVGALRPSRGEVLVNGRPWASVRRTDPERRAVQMVFQDPYAALNPWMTAVETVAEVLTIWDSRRGANADARAREVLSEVGLSADAFDRRPRQLSGGQCQRVGIARALAAKPLVLVADEPTSSLDVSVQAQILNLLTDLRERHGLAIVLISHDLSVVQHLADTTMVLFDGHLVERGPTDAVLVAPSHPYTRILLDSVPGGDGTSRFAANSFQSHAGCVFAERCPLADQACLARQPPPIRHGAVEVACIRPLPAPLADAASTV